MSVKKAAIIVATAMLLFAPALAICDCSDASDAEIQELPNDVDGFKFGDNKEQRGLTAIVMVILLVVIIVVLVLMLKLRKKMNDGHY